MKVCSKCGIQKPDGPNGEFYRKSSGSGSVALYRPHCKTCHNRLAWKGRDKAKRYAYSKQYRSGEAFREWHREYERLRRFWKRQQRLRAAGRLPQGSMSRAKY